MVFKSWDKISIRTDDGGIKEGIAPVIISASRSTDIPAFYAKWFINRLKNGYVKWINPFNQKPQYVSFEKTRMVVFWSKNPKPLIPFLEELDGKEINYYFQFTVNDYDSNGFEPNVPLLAQRIATFKQLSVKLGKQRVIWRFDPLILTDTIGIDELLVKIRNVGEQLKGYTEKFVFSFADIEIYKKVQNNLKRKKIVFKEFDTQSMLDIAQELELLKDRWGIKVATCGEKIDLGKYKIEHNKCIDDELMIKLFTKDSELMDFLGYEKGLVDLHKIVNLKDKGQRKECGCIVSKDIGMYNTCKHLCVYCYANTSEKAVCTNIGKHDNSKDSII